MSDVLALGRKNRLGSYDAAYLDLGIRMDCPWATLDQKLTSAAQRFNGAILQ